MQFVLMIHEPSAFRGQFVMLRDAENFVRGMLLTDNESLASRWDRISLPVQPYGSTALIIRGRQDALEGKVLRHGCSRAFVPAELPADLTTVNTHIAWQLVPATITGTLNEHASVLYCAAHPNLNGTLGMHRGRDGILRIAPVNPWIGEVLGVAHFILCDINKMVDAADSAYCKAGPGAAV